MSRFYRTLCVCELKNAWSSSVHTTEYLRVVKWLFIIEEKYLLVQKRPSLARNTLCVNAPWSANNLQGETAFEQLASRD